MDIRDIPGYEGRYQATSNGRIFSLLRNRYLRPDARTGGYLSVTISDGAGPLKHMNVHTLMARTFIGPRPKGLVINHLNGIETDNSEGNLEYCTAAQNSRHAWDMGLMDAVGKSRPIRKGLRGENHPASRLSDSQRYNIEHLNRSGYGYKRLATLYSRSPMGIKYTISWVRNGP